MYNVFKTFLKYILNYLINYKIVIAQLLDYIEILIFFDFIAFSNRTFDRYNINNNFCSKFNFI